jgi:hypothetical protein
MFFNLAMLIEEHNRLQAERFAAYSRALATTSNGAHTTRPSDAISFPLTQSLSQNLTCPVPCAQYSSCQNCVTANCMWCGSTQRCVSMDTYMISFPYGQCQSWTTATNADKNHICQQGLLFILIKCVKIGIGSNGTIRMKRHNETKSNSGFSCQYSGKFKSFGTIRIKLYE